MITRPIVLSIAGFDPSGGAGILADVKTLEQHKVMGFGVCTAITYQTENRFLGVEWLENKQIANQLLPLLEQYTIKAIKIGLISYSQLVVVLDILSKEIPIIWDPILSASAGFDFDNGLDKNSILEILSKITLLTPNVEEYKTLDLETNLKSSVLLKGGHQKEHKNDLLFLSNGEQITILGKELKHAQAKHGSGCILSSAIAANISLGNTLEQSCRLAKRYVENTLESNTGLLAFHNM